MKANDAALLTPAEYFRDLARMIATVKPGGRVAVATMSLWADQSPVEDIVRELELAARRGVTVYFVIDAYNFLKAGQARPGPLWPRTSLPRKLKEPYHGRVAALERITAAGGHCAVINMPNRPFSPIHGGRSHIKAAVVDGTVYIGGCNLSEPVRYDVMAKWHDPRAAGWVYHLTQNLVEREGTSAALGSADRQLQLDANATLLVDAGVPNQSLILETAYQLIDEAREHVFITCQYFPGGMTARHLKAASTRGVQVTIRYSHPAAHGLEAPGHYLYAARERTRLPADFFAHRLAKGRPLLHAKILCTEKAAMLGSHNYVTQGVSWGTAEIALRCNSPDFSERLRAFILKQIDI